MSNAKNENHRPRSETELILPLQPHRLGNWSRWLKMMTEVTGVVDWSALRCGTTILAGDLGAPPHIISVLLGHANIGGQLVAG